MHQNNKVGLGCGTLILLVLIVIFFGNVGSQNLASQISSLQGSIQKIEQKLGYLEHKMDQQILDIKALLEEIRKMHPQTGQEE